MARSAVERRMLGKEKNHLVETALGYLSNENADYLNRSGVLTFGEDMLEIKYATWKDEAFKRPVQVYSAFVIVKDYIADTYGLSDLNEIIDKMRERFPAGSMITFAKEQVIELQSKKTGSKKRNYEDME